MSSGTPARPAVRRTRPSLLAPLLIAGAALAGVLSYRSFVPASSSPASPIAAEPRAARAETGRVGPGGVTVFSEDPAVANLDPVLLGALRQAATDAAAAGIRFSVTSGWRSTRYQEQLLREAIATYGSAEEAARWVAAPHRSAHVSGDAVDVGPAEAAAWLSQRGAAYGLCRVYGNEPWHFELRPGAAGGGCPPAYPDPTHDPRLRP